MRRHDLVIIRYQPTSASAAAWRGFMHSELTQLRRNRKRQRSNARDRQNYKGAVQPAAQEERALPPTDMVTAMPLYLRPHVTAQVPCPQLQIPVASAVLDSGRQS